MLFMELNGNAKRDLFKGLYKCKIVKELRKKNSPLLERA